MLVTVIADASHCSRTKVAAYGFWIVSKRGKFAGEGVLRGAIHCSVAAEMMAIANALHISLKRKIADEGDTILIQTDCLTAIDILRGEWNKREDLREIGTIFRKMYANHALQVRFKHVKGHSKAQDQRSKAQRMSDSRAKRTMRQARDAQRGST